MKQTIRQKTTEARKLYERYVELDRFTNLAKWEQAEILYKWKIQGLFRFVFGDEGDSTKEKAWYWFCKQIGIPLSTANDRVKRYHFYRIKNSIPVKTLAQINARALNMAIKFIEKGDVKMIEVLDNGTKLPIDEFEKWIKGNEEPCWHIAKKRVSKEIEICEDCGKEVHAKKHAETT